MPVVARAFRAIPRLLRGLVVGWIEALVDVVRRICRRILYRKRLKKLKQPEPCAVLPPDVYKRPDPMIYCQSYLLSQGLAVTYDNPDIQIYRAGASVPSSELLPDTDYTIAARIWNGSTEAPAVDLAVDFAFQSFGIGAELVGLGRTFVTLPVNGGVGHPALAEMAWHTPPTPGHYCLLVDLVWPDDANPANNRGQENTDVRPLNSPRAEFTLPVRNDRAARRSMVLEVDGYELIDPPSCDGRPAASEPKLSEAERRAHLAEARRRAGRGAFPVPAGWTVTVSPSSVDLGAGEAQDINVEVVAPDGFTGRKAFNVNALVGDTLAGGVTLLVEGA